MNYFRVILTLFILLIPALVFAQQPPSEKPKEDPAGNVIRLDTKLVVIDAQVINKQTKSALLDLMKEDFLLSENGVKQEITNFSKERLPLSIVLLFEIDNNIVDMIERLRKGPIQALRRLLPDDEVALMAFGASTELMQDFTTDKQKIIDRLDRDRLEPLAKQVNSDMPFIKKAVYQAGVQLRKARNPASRRVVIIITNNLSKEPLLKLGTLESKEETLDMLAQTGAIVSAMINVNLSKKLRHELSKQTLDQIIISKLFSKSNINIYANETGGEVLTIEDGNDPEAVFMHIVENLRTRYVFGYVSTTPDTNKDFRKIELRVRPEVEQRIGDLTIKARHGYDPENYLVSKTRPAYSPLAEPIKPSFQTVDLMPIFWHYWQQAKDQDKPTKIRLFQELVIKAQPEIFTAELFNLDQSKPFEQALAERLDVYLDRISVHITRLNSLTGEITNNHQRNEQIFLQQFGDFNWSGKIYFLPNLGAGEAIVQQINGSPALIFGLDSFVLAHGRSIKFTPLFYQELFRLYYQQFHNSKQDHEPLVYQVLWQEGLVVYVAKLLNQTASNEENLLSETSFEKTVTQLPRLASRLRDELDTPMNPLTYQQFFAKSSTGNDPYVRPGYYIGLLIAENLANGYRLPDLLKLQGEDLRRAMEVMLRKLER